MTKPKARTIFLTLGIAGLVAMLLTLPQPWPDVLATVRRAGIALPHMTLLWLPIYTINALAWRTIINDGTHPPLPFLRIMRLTVAGYALNYVTPVGLLGGEPYRIVELTPQLGRTKAASSVVLYSTTHIASHFLFWLLGLALCLATYGLSLGQATNTALLIVALFALAGLALFARLYRHGCTTPLMRLYHTRWKPLRSLVRRMGISPESISRFSNQMNLIRNGRTAALATSIALELAARIVGVVEVWIALRVFSPTISFADALLVQSFSSLMANLVFFMPMQIGAREGSLALVEAALRHPASHGIASGLLIRLREIAWIGIGLALVGKKDTQ